MPTPHPVLRCVGSEIRSAPPRHDPGRSAAVPPGQLHRRDEQLVLRCTDGDVELPLQDGDVQAYAELATLFGEYEELNLDEDLPVPLRADAVVVLVAWLVAAAGAPLEIAAVALATRAAEALTDPCLCERAQQAAHFFGAAKLEAACGEQLKLRPEFVAASLLVRRCVRRCEVATLVRRCAGEPEFFANKSAAELANLVAAPSDADGWVAVEATELEALRWPHEEASQRRFLRIRQQRAAEQARAATPVLTLAGRYVLGVLTWAVWGKSVWDS